jgi:membrane protease YdiL (CAAX protease family)
VSTTAPVLPARSFPPSRLRSFIAFVLALMYVFAAQTIARHAASGLSAGDWVLPIDRLFFFFLLLLGFSALAAGFSRERERRRALGLVARPGMGREFATGAAVGWGLLLLTVLPSVFIGGLNARLWTGPHQWFLLLLDLVVLLVSALCTELIFRGYPYQQLMESIGTTLATVFISICFVAVEYDPQMPHAAVFALFLLSLILCIGYLRTRALWLPWGLHFAWNAAMAPLFGLPLSGMGSRSFTPVVQTVALGPDFVTGGDYGPEGSGIAVLVLLVLGIWVVMRTTREYSARYGHPEIIAAGIPVDIDAAARRQHEAAMGPMAEPEAPAAPRLVQIGGAPPAVQTTVPPPLAVEPPAQD